MGFFDWIKLPTKRSPKDDAANVNEPTSTSAVGNRGAKLPLFRDLPTEIAYRAYDQIYSQDVTYHPLLKRAKKCGGFTAMVIGEGERRDQLQDVVDNSMGMPQTQEFLSYSDVEGVRGVWMMASPRGKMNVVSFLGGGMKKWKAGGELWWGGFQSRDAVRLSPRSSTHLQEDVTLDRNRLLVHCPTIEVNPDGDTTLGLNLLRIATLGKLLEGAMQVYTERHSLPKEIIELVMREYSPSFVTSAASAALATLQDANAMKSWSTTPDEALKMVEASGKTWQFLLEMYKLLATRAHKLTTGEFLTSGTDTGDIPELAERQFFSAAAYAMKLMGESFTHDFLPYAEKINEHWLAPRKKKDPPMWIEFRAPIEKQQLKPAEMLQIMDRWYPTTYADASAVFGTELPPGVDPKAVFLKPGMPSVKAEEPAKPDDKVPSSTGETDQRTDREQEDSNIPADDTRKQDKNEDLRTVDKDKEE
jgi:hypothetical protein